MKSRLQGGARKRQYRKYKVKCGLCENQYIENTKFSAAFTNINVKNTNFKAANIWLNIANWKWNIKNIRWFRCWELTASILLHVGHVWKCVCVISAAKQSGQRYPSWYKRQLPWNFASFAREYIIVWWICSSTKYYPRQEYNRHVLLFWNQTFILPSIKRSTQRSNSTFWVIYVLGRGFVLWVLGRGQVFSHENTNNRKHCLLNSFVRFQANNQIIFKMQE